MDALSEHIMVEFLLSSAKRNTMTIGLSDPHGMTSVLIHGSPIQSNIAQSIAYEISKRRLLQHLDDWNLTHMSDWDEIDLILFKKLRETTTAHMVHFITKLMSNTLPTMTILQQ